MLVDYTNRISIECWSISLASNFGIHCMYTVPNNLQHHVVTKSHNYHMWEISRGPIFVDNQLSMKTRPVK